jgi:N utilization substance protein A
MTALTAPATPLTSLAGVGAKTIEKIEAAGINSVEKLAGMTPEQLMEIPGIGEKMVDKIYQAVNRFYESGTEAAGAATEGAAAEGAVSTETPAEDGEATGTETTETDETNEAPAETPAKEEAAAQAAPAETHLDAEQAEGEKS